MDECSPLLGPRGHFSFGETYFSFIIWQRKLLHKCFNITSKTQLCGNFRSQILKEKSASPDELLSIVRSVSDTLAGSKRKTPRYKRVVAARD
jgi:hypothetical protein